MMSNMLPTDNPTRSEHAIMERIAVALERIAASMESMNFADGANKACETMYEKVKESAKMHKEILAAMKK